MEVVGGSNHKSGPSGLRPTAARGVVGSCSSDETSLRRRHRYVTVVSNAETWELLGVVKHRDFRALSTFLASQGQPAF